jgi:hypothetical protein
VATAGEIGEGLLKMSGASTALGCNQLSNDFSRSLAVQCLEGLIFLGKKHSRRDKVRRHETRHRR